MTNGDETTSQSQGPTGQERITPPDIQEDGEDRPVFESTPPTTRPTAAELSPNQYQVWRSSQGIILIFVCLALILALSLLSVVPWARDNSVIPEAVETLKLITTTVVGFVFGSHTLGGNKKN